MANKGGSSGTVTKLVAVKPEAAAPASGLAALCDALSSQFAERDGAIRAVARALVAGQHVFILGEPGTGKSLLARVFSKALGLSYWETLMTRFSTPEDVFGPLSITQLQKDRYVRATDGYLPSAEVGFLDECWKANGGILNALLTITNERVYHNDGKPQPCPLISLVGASNELPESDSELGALYDRFLVRLVASYVEDRAAFSSMLFGDEPSVPKIALDIKAEQAAARAVVVPAAVQQAIVDLRYKARETGFKVSDRRWRQCVSLIKASAHLDGRTEASVDDLECLEDVLWRAPEERIKVARLIQEVSSPDGAEAVEILDQAKEVFGKCQAFPTDDKTKLMGVLAQAGTDFREMNARLAKLTSGRKVNGAVAEVKKLEEARKQLAAHAMGLG